MTQKHKITDGKKVTVDEAEMKSVLMDQKDFLVPVVQEAVQAMLEVEMEECLQAGKHERNEQRLGYRSGYYRRRLITRVGTMVLRVAQREGVGGGAGADVCAGSIDAQGCGDH